MSSAPRRCGLRRARRAALLRVDDRLGLRRTVTFSGQTSITIPAGGLAVGERGRDVRPGALRRRRQHVLRPVPGSSTFHRQGAVTNYIASGDVAQRRGPPRRPDDRRLFFLTNLNVQNTSAQGAVVTLGASITDGYASTTDANERWPNDLAILAGGLGRAIGVLNQGISGNRLLADGSGQSALNRFSRDVVSQPGVKWVIFSDDPINDLGSTSRRPRRPS